MKIKTKILLGLCLVGSLFQSQNLKCQINKDSIPISEAGLEETIEELAEDEIVEIEGGAEINGDTIVDEAKSSKGPHTFHDLVSNYNGYVTNYINVTEADNDNLLIKTLRKRKKVKWLMDGYSYSSIVLLNAIIKGAITDEDFIDEYLDYAELPFLKNLKETLDSGEVFDLELVTTAPENKNLISDICLLHQLAPDSSSPKDRIFFDAIRSAYVQIKENNFKTSGYNNTDGAFNYYSVYGYGRSNYLSYSKVKPIFDYFDTTRKRILSQYAENGKHAKVAFENLQAERWDNQKVKDIYFRSTNQKLALKRIWDEDPTAFVILEVDNDNLSKKSFDSVSQYQTLTLLQSLKSDGRFSQKMASVCQLSLLEINQSEMEDFEDQQSQEDKEFNAILNEYYFGNDSLIYEYFDFLDDNHLDRQTHFGANNRNVWTYDYYKYSYSDDFGDHLTDEHGDLGASLFFSVGYNTNSISRKNKDILQGVDISSSYTGYNFTLGFISYGSGVYASFYNSGNLNDFYFRHVEMSSIVLIPISKKYRNYITFKSPLRYSVATLVNPNDRNYYSSPTIENREVEVAKTNGFSIGLGAKYIIFPMKFWSVSAEASYYTNSFYKAGWRVGGNRATNLDPLNFRGSQFNISTSIYLNSL